MESNPKILFRSDSVAGKNGDEGDSDDGCVFDVLASELPILMFGAIPVFKWMLPFVVGVTKRVKIGVLHGDGEVWRLSLGSDPLVIILFD